MDAARREYLGSYYPAEARRPLAEAGFARGLSTPIFHWSGFPQPWRSHIELTADNLGRRIGLPSNCAPRS